MRGTVSGLASPRPLGPALPAIYQEDALLQQFLTAFDDVLAPVFCSLDNLTAYFDPRLTPPDFLAWLAGWLGLVIDDNWPLERRRRLASEAAGLYRWRGTVKGLATEVALHTGGDAEVAESGGCIWSSRPGGPIPGTRDSYVRVVVNVADSAAVNLERLQTMIAGAIPADIVFDVVVLGPGEQEPGAGSFVPEPEPPVAPEAAATVGEGTADAEPRLEAPPPVQPTAALIAESSDAPGDDGATPEASGSDEVPPDQP